MGHRYHTATSIAGTSVTLFVILSNMVMATSLAKVALAQEALAQEALAQEALAQEALAQEALAEEALADEASTVSFGREIRPILVQHCYECHGPDDSGRQAELRLDKRELAIRATESGGRPIDIGEPAQSEIIKRMRGKGERKMPPDGKPSPTPAEIVLIEKWIEQGALWDVHWAFAPIVVGVTGPISDDAETVVDAILDRYVDGDETATFPRVSRETLARRVYLDLVGLPPSIEELNRFLNDDRPNAYARLVDRLLASPRYGERWGRHWLDVARYGDSNGGDENHAYPLAHRYRDYVIDAFNRDLPYNEFVVEQLAGDLLPFDKSEIVGSAEVAGTAEIAHGRRMANEARRERTRRVTATGYLAIGMKILAERDPVKKQADLVDEQIDTVGRTFLGLSLGCARCHDHKFDPVPTRDYYALAGIFHSTSLVESELVTADHQRLLAEHARRLTELDEQIALLERQLGIDRPGARIEREAESFDRGNVIIDRESYGKGIGIISDPGGQKNFAEYDVEVADTGRFLLQLRFAAAASRPGRVLLDGEKIIEPAFQQTTGSWYPDTQRWFNIGSLMMSEGSRTLRFESEPTMSHLDRWRLLRVDDPKLLDEWEQKKKQHEALVQQTPTAQKVMAASDAAAKDVAIHIRGSHLELGEVVARGVMRSWQTLARTSTDGASTGGASTDGASAEGTAHESSGRLELARWLTARDTPAGNLAARVIVNRVWHWHFGIGISATSDDFGVRGESPRYPELLDYLASELVRGNWSLKQLHRNLVLSRTYQESAVSADVANAAHPVWKATRLDAEVLRDSLLFVADQLDFQIGNSPMVVKSQDPSPQDMAANLEKYRSSRRRSVYLPVVRSNVYGFLTLFDFPNAASPVADRDETTVPTQGLWMLNSPVIQRAADQVAETLVERQDRRGGDWNESIQWLFMKVLTRQPTADESDLLHELWQQAREDSASGDDAKAQLSKEAWATVIQALMFSNEAIYTP